jgi:hypothetical protein
MQASHPANYRIAVEGTLDPMWLPCLSGFEVAESQPPEQQEHERGAVTRLEGRVVDQAALQGVLDTLFMLGLRLVLVECLPPAP